jgi:NADH:ubiquinone oxidoreductase subunit 6 (subunit J)
LKSQQKAKTWNKKENYEMGLLLFGIPAAIIAKVKGFNSLRWLLALGIVGFVWVLFLNSANAKGISPDESASRVEKANTVGAWLCGINLGLSTIVILILLAVNS